MARQLHKNKKAARKAGTKAKKAAPGSKATAAAPGTKAKKAAPGTKAKKAAPGTKDWKPQHGRYSKKLRRRIKKPKKVYAGNRGADLRPRLAGKRRKRMAKLGLVEPAQMSKRELRKLQAEWYERLRADGFEDAEVVTFKGPSEAALKIPTARARPWRGDERQLYFYLGRNYMTWNGYWRPHYMKTAWRLHMDGLSYREIKQALNKEYGYNKSIYTLFYEIEEEAKRCVRWNKESKHGALNETTFDSEMDSPLAGGWGMRLAEGFWDEVPDGFVNRAWKKD